VRRNRRQVIRGHWIGHSAQLPSPDGATEIASILVQTRPERLAAAEAAIGAIAGAEIFQRDQRGKLVVVVEAVRSDPVGEILTRISLLPDVITATLVYHAIEDNSSPVSKEDIAP
jgi:nitrate reductase NapD